MERSGLTVYLKLTEHRTRTRFQHEQTNKNLKKKALRRASLTCAVCLAAGKAEYLLAEVFPLLLRQVVITGQKATGLKVAGGVGVKGSGKRTPP